MNEEQIDERQPSCDTEHIEIIEVEGKKIAVEYGVSVSGLERTDYGVGVILNVDNLRLSYVH